MNALAGLTRTAFPALNLVRAYGTKTCYVGNIPWGTSEEQIQDLFTEFGQVERVRLPLDDAGRIKGFGFVELDEEAAAKAIDSLNGFSFNGRDLRVNEAQERAPRNRTFNNGRSFGDRPNFNRNRDF
ncbi:hypothetical protein K493DRAFT_311953 [Basidiobolus meristosporus CBS 931.73]|uniref:RRM domain-containing protein n=1 Tax=Basidiobolus meristosporus CBS 931.73 TaxID=1314790 RepID=A0A1Y1YXS0_9FUNG|nr:hypothetical protein K493DRAFT_311953 [Basidiobolus meristosporus CBS 931.73]|eukprot:ORY02779.1 hypothetical protein K493DRAFT_311953 [Basidiobolus meristosporus CBS 931.73]